MSDYLNNLLAKTLKLTEVIQPRLLSLFEPPNTTGTSIPWGSSGPEMEDEKPFAEKPSDDSSPTLPSERPSARHLQESLVIPKLQRPETDPAPHSIRPLIHQMKKSSGVTDTTVRKVPQDIAPERLMPHAAASVPTPIVPHPGATREGRQPVLKPAIPHTEPSPGQTTCPSMLKMAVAQPQVMPYIEPKTQAAPEIIPIPKPAPSIQVTIGRVEVRAIPPPARPLQKKRSAAPVMSLDEYLRRRTKGGRQ